MLVWFLVFIIYGGTAFQRNLVWRTEASLYQDVVSKTKNKARVYNNLGKAFMDKKMFDKAIPALKEAIVHDRRYEEPHYNLAIIYTRQAMWDKAIKEFEEVLKVVSFLKKSKNHPMVIIKFEKESIINLGNIYAIKKDYKMAIDRFKQAIGIEPKDINTHFNLAVTYKRAGYYREAIDEFKEVLRLNPNDKPARMNLMMLMNTR